MDTNAHKWSSPVGRGPTAEDALFLYFISEMERAALSILTQCIRVHLCEFVDGLPHLVAIYGAGALAAPGISDVTPVGAGGSSSWPRSRIRCGP